MAATMDYPKFVPAGNSLNGFNPNEMIDLNDIFDGKYLVLIESSHLLNWTILQSRRR